MIDYYDLNCDFLVIHWMTDLKLKWYVGVMKNKINTSLTGLQQTLQQSQKLSFYFTIQKDYSPSP